MKQTVSIFFLLLTLLFCPQADATTGTWKAYMAYNDITEVAKGGSTLYVLASKNLYTYHSPDQEVRTYDKTNGLSDCNIAHIAWADAVSRLVIVYENENIDIMEANGNVINVSDYYSKSMIQDKTVYSIDIHGTDAYLATGFGLVKLQVKRAEISDTYNLGFRVDYSYVQGSRIYASSSTEGLYSAPLNANLADKKNWSHIGAYVPRPKQIDPDLLTEASRANPGGPKYNHFGFMLFHQGALYTCGGGYQQAIDHSYPGIVQVLRDDKWTIFEDDLSKRTGHIYEDVMSVDVDPSDPDHVFAGSRGGVYEFKNGQFIKEWSYDNSLLQSAYKTDKNYVIAKGVRYDGQGNLWVINCCNPTQSLLKYTKEGQWVSHHQPALIKNNTVPNHQESLFLDSSNRLWFGCNNWEAPSVSCYDISKDEFNTCSAFVNEDGMHIELGSVTCIAEDRDRNIWIGTNAGPLVLPQGTTLSSNNIFEQIKVPRNDGTNLADYLLAGVSVTCIAVDGAGRKWIGTDGNGVYLISADNMTQEQHFTEQNSALLSNLVESVAVDPTTGEVFFGTYNGLCSYRSDATSPAETMTKGSVNAYPNPVRPDYTGLITVTGLTFNADVKIVTTNGTLVKQGRSNGGTFTWDGCDQKGRRVVSGVYMVQTATAEGEKGTVCKIAIIR